MSRLSGFTKDIIVVAVVVSIVYMMVGGNHRGVVNSTSSDRPAFQTNQLMRVHNHQFYENVMKLEIFGPSMQRSNPFVSSALIDDGLYNIQICTGEAQNKSELGFINHDHEH